MSSMTYVVLDKIESNTDANICGIFPLYTTYDNILLLTCFEWNVKISEVSDIVETISLSNSHLQVNPKGEFIDTVYIRSVELIKNEADSMIIAPKVRRKWTKVLTKGVPESTSLQVHCGVLWLKTLIYLRRSLPNYCYSDIVYINAHETCIILYLRSSLLHLSSVSLLFSVSFNTHTHIYIYIYSARQNCTTTCRKKVASPSARNESDCRFLT